MATKKVRVDYPDGKVSIQGSAEAEPREYTVKDGHISPRSNEDKAWLLANAAGAAEEE
jgi:hypothetical protein